MSTEKMSLGDEGAEIERASGCIECDEGVVNRYDEDPMWYDDEWVNCNNCHGHGRQVWCPKCGLDLLSKEAELLNQSCATDGNGRKADAPQ